MSPGAGARPGLAGAPLEGSGGRDLGPDHHDQCAGVNIDLGVRLFAGRDAVAHRAMANAGVGVGAQYGFAAATLRRHARRPVQRRRAVLRCPG